ncbi:MAG: tetratricopeptide repeat protein, partial [Ardenticatenales bacterium]|nr:tetratricopeptide repeat protein [Ardenticatenales bacterium]
MNCLRHALHLRPEFAEAQNNLGNVLLDQGNLDDAMECFQQATHLQSDFAEAHINLGAALHKQGRIEEALASFEEALQIQSDNRALRIKIATLLPVIYRSVEELQQWRTRLVAQVEALLRDNITLDPLKENIQSNFLLAYQGLDDREIQEKIARLYLPIREVAPRLVDPSQRKIRIGFLSRYFKNHTIGHLNRGLIATLSRDDFEVTVLSLGYHEDEGNQFIREHADRYLELPAHLQTASQSIAELGLDILFFTDIGMEPLSYALASVRLAPVQCVTWGHPVTTGLPAVDYFLSSALMEDEVAAAHYSETLVRLNSLTTYYYPPSLPSVLK